MLAITPAGLDALAADMADRDAWLRVALGELSQAEVELLGIAGRLMDRITYEPGIIVVLTWHTSGATLVPWTWAATSRTSTNN